MSEGTNLESVANEELERWKVPGVAVATWQDGKIERAGFGITSLDTKQPVTADTLFQIGSISKVFTAALIMRLVEEDLLDLDTPIAAYLPELTLADPTAPKTVTLRHLLSHSSGIEGDRFEDLYGMGDDALTRAVAEFNTLKQLTAPGELWTYCNNGFSLAGAVIEKVLGEPFEKSMKERIFQPLGMERAFYFAHQAITYPVAVGHSQKPDQPVEIARNYPLPRYVNPAGGVISTVGDLLKFAAPHLGDGSVGETRLWSAASVREMQKPQVRAGNFARAYGIGWAIYDEGDPVVLGHGGSTNGFQAHLALVPARNFAVAILTNGDKGAKVHGAIEKWALKHHLGVELKDPEPIDMPAEGLARFAGRYRTSYSETLVTPQDNGLVAEISVKSVLSDGETTTYPSMVMKPISALEFIVTEGDWSGMRVDFLGNDGEPPRRLRNGGRIAERIAEDAPRL